MELSPFLMCCMGCMVLSVQFLTLRSFTSHWQPLDNHLLYSSNSSLERHSRFCMTSWVHLDSPPRRLARGLLRRLFPFVTRTLARVWRHLKSYVARGSVASGVCSCRDGDVSDAQRQNVCHLQQRHSSACLQFYLYQYGYELCTYCLPVLRLRLPVSVKPVCICVSVTTQYSHERILPARTWPWSWALVWLRGWCRSPSAESHRYRDTEDESGRKAKRNARSVPQMFYGFDKVTEVTHKVGLKPATTMKWSETFDKTRCTYSRRTLQQQDRYQLRLKLEIIVDI